MIIGKNFLQDGSTSFEKGVETHKAPTRVPRHQLCNLINATTRTDFLGCRPAWEQVELEWADEDAQAIWETGLFQRVAGYIPDTGAPQLVASVSGHLLRLDAFSDGQAMDLRTSAELASDPNPTNRPLAWFKQAELFLIWQDGQSVPLIYDGATVRRSNVKGTGGTDADGTPLYEVPVGTVMEYSGGRLWVTLPDGRSFVGGDGVYGPTGTPAYQRRDALLRFTENRYWAGGSPFAVPSNIGPITAMRALANLDTSLGQGPMQVFTASGAFSIQAPFDREAWALVQDPIKTVSLLQYGFLGQESTVLVNGDLWGRALNGVRSFIIARRDFGTWGNRAMSHEVSKWLDRDEDALLLYGSAATFDDRLLMTTGPFWDRERGICHSGQVVLDFHPLTSIGEVEQPTWEGFWHGDWGDVQQVLGVVARGVEYCFAVVLGVAGEDGVRRRQLWRLTKAAGPDVGVEEQLYPLTRIIEGPFYDFAPSGSNRLEQKLLEASDWWIEKVSGTVDFWLYYRPDQYPCWFFWKHWQVCAKTQRCVADATLEGDRCLAGLNLKPTFRARLGSLRPPDATVTGTLQQARVGYGFQYRLEVRGQCDITAVRLLASRIVEQTFGAPGAGVASCDELVCCPEEPPAG